MSSDRPRQPILPDTRVSMYHFPYRIQRRSLWRRLFDLFRGR